MPTESENLETIKKFKAMFTQEEAMKFLSLQVRLMMALEKYDASTKDDTAFLPLTNSGREYARDKASKINLTTLSAMISLVANNNTEYLISNLVPIRDAAEQLKEDIAVFKKYDQEPGRQKTYQEGLDYFDKILALLSRDL